MLYHMASRTALEALLFLSLLLIPSSLQARNLLDFIEVLPVEIQHSSPPIRAEESSVASDLGRRKWTASNERILGSVPSPGVGH